MTQQRQTAEQLFAGNGEMARLMRSLDWSQTPLGSISSWDSSLRTAVSICLHSRFPMVIWWGKELVLLYNDAWQPILGIKHPKALGRPGQEVWSEIWDVIGVQLHSVLETAQATWSDDTLLLVDRYGYTEEAYFTYSYSPIFLDTGAVGGAFTAVTETTRRVIGERRLSTLRELAANTVEAKSVEETCRVASTTLTNNPYDLPFALLYLIQQDGKQACLVGTVRMEAGTTASPEQLDLTQATDPWKVGQVVSTGNAEIVDELTRQFGALSGGAWDDPSRAAIVLPIVQAGQKQQLAGVLVLGISPRCEFDDEYRGFCDLVASHFATAIATAQAYEEERKRAEALAELDRAKTTFFSNVSHEFRTPLTLMLSPLEELSQTLDERLKPDERAQLQLVQRNGLRLQKLVNTLLDFSRLEAGRVQASYEPIDLAAYTAELASIFRSLIEQAGMKLIIDCPALPEPVYVDRDMWEKIVLNLLSNAFKFTFAGSITVRLQAVGDAVELSVSDTGVGIPEAELSRLFERFHRVSVTRSRTYEGSGIGLALVQELIKLHGGTIRVASQLEQGTTFTIALPLGSTHLPSDRLQPSNAQSLEASRTLASTTFRANPYVEEALRWLPEGSGGEAGEVGEVGEAPLLSVSASLAPSVPLAPFTPSARLLLADDNADMRDYVKRLLSQYWEVETVSNGLEALEAIAQRPPDLIVSDVMMPRLDGFGLIHQLRSDPRTREIPIILLSARAGEEARIEGLEAGADDYLIKPFSARELLARVESNLKLARLRREAAQQEQALRLEVQAVKDNMENVLTRIADQFSAWDRHWRCNYANDQVTQVTGISRETLLGKTLWELFPDIVGSYFEAEVRRAVTEQMPVQFEYFYPPLKRWFENHVYPSADGVSIISTEITDRKQAEAEREQLLAREQAAREHAETANRIKDEFLAVLSHELRSPLNPILGWSKLLRNGKLDATRTEQALETIERNAQLQVQLIDDLLDISRILSGKLTLNVTAVDLNFIIAAALETVHLSAEAKALQVQTITSPTIGSVNGDAGRLQQVVWNLLSNAVKFTPAGGHITIELATMGTNAQIQVKDTGKGISPSFLPYVFEYFRQEDGATTRKFGGLGLGLAIVRQIVEMHGGTVTAASPGEGQGAVFTVQIPLASTALPARKPASEAILDLDRLHVLVVDDDADSRDFMMFVLKQANAIVTSVASGMEALQYLQQATPDLVVSDIGMPAMDGYMLMQQIRSLEQGRTIPAIALTAYAGEMNQKQALAAGFQQHLSKPVEPQKIVMAIVNLVNRAPK